MVKVSNYFKITGFSCRKTLLQGLESVSDVTACLKKEKKSEQNVADKSTAILWAEASRVTNTQWHIS
jgi:hypothetical protein